MSASLDRCRYLLNEGAEHVPLDPVIDRCFERISKILSAGGVPVRVLQKQFTAWTLVACTRNRSLRISGGMMQALTLQLGEATEEMWQGKHGGSICTLRIADATTFYGYEYSVSCQRNYMLLPAGLPEETKYSIPRSTENERTYLGYADILAHHMVQVRDGRVKRDMQSLLNDEA